jgi:hypothetical protein
MKYDADLRREAIAELRELACHDPYPHAIERALERLERLRRAR